MQPAVFNGQKDRNQYLDQLYQPPEPFVDKKKRGGARRRGRPPKELIISECTVCGDTAPNYIHYGAVTCFPCR